MKKYTSPLFKICLLLLSLTALAAPTKKMTVTYNLAWYPLANANSYTIYYRYINTTKLIFLTNLTQRVCSATFSNGTPKVQFFGFANLHATNKFVNLNFSWDASPDPKVTGYLLYYGPSNRYYTNFQYQGDNSFGQVTNLSVSNMYYFTVVAYDIRGQQSDYSNETNWFPILSSYTNSLALTVSGPITNTTGQPIPPIN